MTASDSTVVNGSNDRDSPDYASDVPTTKPPEEFTYQERRADLLTQVRDLGAPSMLNQSEEAERYGVSQQQISKDLDRISESVREHLTDRDRRALALDSVMQRSVVGLLRNEEWRAAARTMMQYQEFLQDWSDVERLEAELEELRAEVTEGLRLTEELQDD